MKSRLWFLCGVALLCFGSVRCHFSDDDRNFLDTRRDGVEERTEKEADIETELYKARNTWNDLKNEISELHREKRDGETTGKCSVDADCKNGGKCEDTMCKCVEGTSGDICDIINDCVQGGMYENCAGDRGTCEFNENTKKTFCTCSGEKVLYDKVNYCEDKCSDNKPCPGSNRKCEEEFCTCEVNYIYGQDNNTCLPKCSKDDECAGDNRKCKDNKFCVCKDGYEGDDCQTITGCKKLNEMCKKIEKECIHDKDAPDMATCDCGDDYIYHRDSNTCLKKCSKDDDCKYKGSTCNKQSNLCKCVDGTSGDTCDIINDCVQGGKYQYCTGDRGNCDFNEEDKKAVCSCSEEKKLYEKAGYCEDKCAEDKSCSGSNRKCNEDEFCVCEDGYEGDDCQTITGCKDLEAKCKQIERACIFDGSVPEKATCECDEGFKYMRDSNRCVKTCSDDEECLYGSTCNKQSKLCDCVNGTSGDTCEKVNDCEKGGKYENCTGDKGKCEFKIDVNKAVCSCPEGKLFHDKLGYCEEDNCTKVCGVGFGVQDNEAVKCNAKSPFGNVECECKDAKMAFDALDKECKTDYCKDVCGKVKCKGNKFEEDTITCECQENYDFDEEGKKCKRNYCKTTCGTDKNVKCNGDPYKTKALKDCSCDGEEYIFKDKRCQKKCTDDDECEYEGSTCNKQSNLCDCVKGTFGDTCEKIVDCEKGGKYEKCTGDDGTCEFDEEKKKAVCNCAEPKLLNEKAGYCQDDNCTMICGIGFGKENDELKCEAKNPFGKVKCVCKDKNLAFDGTDKECKTDYCKKKCGTVECDGNPFEEDKITCVCQDSYDFDEEGQKCKLNYCRRICGPDEDVKCAGDPYQTKTSKDCTCEDGYAFKYRRCQKKCSKDEDCQYGGKCGKQSNLCECVKGTFGDECEKIRDCESNGKYENCKGDRGECGFNKESKESTCTCSKEKTLYKALGYCEATCTEDKDCSGSRRTCNKDKFCVCQDGYEGEDCEIVTGCKVLEETCKEIKTDCIFDKNATDKATCDCKYPLIYDRTNNKCLHPYCFPNNPCIKPAECTPDESTTGGYCKCPENEYYNYKTQRCEGLSDKCLLRKTPCGENFNCKNGKCECKIKVKEGEECKVQFCTTNACFSKANCSEDDGGTCFCDKGKYYKENKCTDLKCNWREFKTNCTCPTGMERKENGEECVPKKDKGEACKTDCGYGLCVKNKDKESCKCFDFATGTNGGKCLLKKTFCAGEALQEGSMKCKCEGQYTQATDGITCRLKTCEDSDATKDCESKGGKCKMNWKGNGYFCECPSGYDKDENGKCTDPCSLEKNIKICSDKDQFCYNSLSSLNAKSGSCSCPPTVVQGDDKKCSKKADYVYLIKNIQVLKKRYELKSGINKVLLSSDLTKSLELSFSRDLYAYGYLYDYRVERDMVNCSLWINFRKEPSAADLDTIKFIPRTFSIKDCDDCDKSINVWPPNVLLMGEGLKEANYNKVEFCSDEVKDLFCGKGAVCKESKCTCGDGFKIIEYSIKEIGPYKAQRCEDIDECAIGSHSCTANTTCVNTFGSYKCVCKEGFKKEKEPKDPETDKSNCYDMCTPSPCKKGKCVVKDNTFDCECDPGDGGSLCDRQDLNYASAKKGTVVVGAVLGTILAIGAIAILYYIIKVRKNSGSEDFVPAPRMDHAEMAERRGMRGVTNRGYE